MLVLYPPGLTLLKVDFSFRCSPVWSTVFMGSVVDSLYNVQVGPRLEQNFLLKNKVPVP